MACGDEALAAEAEANETNEVAAEAAGPGINEEEAADSPVVQASEVN